MPASDIQKPAPPRCPVCASADAKMTIETNYGAYWRCNACGHVWHEDARPRPKTPPFFERYWGAALAQIGRELIDLRSRLPETPIRRRKACA
ncbi:MAG TPA: hypothetical protein VL225_09210 [Vicinamibacterales bacterium]|nr:hypothetical protein [Vicinamibacterales bacterium]